MQRGNLEKRLEYIDNGSWPPDALCLDELRLDRLPDLNREWSGQVELVDLSSNRFEVLPEAISVFENLKTLDLRHNQLESLPEFLGDFAKLETILLSDNKFRTVPNALSKCRSLRHLDMSRNTIRFLDVEIWFRGLETLSLNHNQIERVPPEIGRCSSLETLNLSCNRLADLPEQMFVGCRRLVWLAISENPLTSLPRGLLDLPRLRELYALGCPIVWSELPLVTDDADKLLKKYFGISRRKKRHARRKGDPIGLDEVILAETSSGGEYCSADIISALRRWRNSCDFEIKNAGADFLVLVFKSLPSDPTAFLSDVARLCPDFEVQGATGDETDLDIVAQTSLFQRSKCLQLWWD